MKIKGEYIAKKHIFVKPVKKQFIVGKHYCIIFIAKGTVICHEKDNSYRCNTENILLLKPGTSIVLEYVGGKYPLELLETGFTPDILNLLSDEQVGLEACFNVVPSQCICVRSDSEITMLIKNLTKNLISISPDSTDFGNSLYLKGIITMLIVLIIRACIHAETKKRSNSRKHLMLDDIFVYIRSHIAEEITLEQLEQEFFVSRYHISREFKKHTGITVHQYIIKNKLDLCKRYIEEGKPIIEVYKLCGFGGYNHLFRAFKKEFGITPKEYYHQTKQR